MTDPRRCIHGRTERQACAKCNAMDAAPAEGLKWLVDCGIASCPFRGEEHIGHGMSVARAALKEPTDG